MRKLTALLGIAYMTLVSATAQTVDLFKREGKDIIPKEQFIAFYEKESIFDYAKEKKTHIYKEFDTTSSNGIYQYKISMGGLSPNSENGIYENLNISYKGKNILHQYGYAPLWDVSLLTMNKDDRNYYIKVPLDDNSFALLFAGLVFDGDDEAGEMIVVVVNQDKATMVYDRPACAYSFTPAPNFAIEFTEKTDDILNADGYAIGAKADMKATKHKIWKEGNMLKYKSWN